MTTGYPVCEDCDDFYEPFGRDDGLCPDCAALYAEDDDEPDGDSIGAFVLTGRGLLISLGVVGAGYLILVGLADLAGAGFALGAVAAASVGFWIWSGR